MNNTVYKTSEISFIIQQTTSSENIILFSNAEWNILGNMSLSDCVC